MIDAIVRARKIKQTLDVRCKGMTMIKQDKSLPANQAKGFWDFNLFFDNPSNSEKQAIIQTLRHFKARFGRFHVVGGAYGFRIHFKLGEWK